ncbi:hypothetical protein [Paraburkholderia sp. J12]|uniref:hypothetical protein n=1 Tax=Paraburkholderia sp. J12 TaxID=2805432 RepID=UPI002ABDF851|nr:hypothetical protein [Paraburkholderia sp. J12]
MPTMPYTMRVWEFKQRIADQLKDLPPNAEVCFGQGDLAFYRIKNLRYVGDTDTPLLVQIEFTQTYQVTFDPEQAD